MMFWYGPGMGGWGYGLMAVSSLVFWALVVVAVVLLVRYFSRAGGGTASHSPPGGMPSRGSAEQLLAERFARGEISAGEYRERLQILREEGGVPSGSQP